jgi:hypothetical protein
MMIKTKEMMMTTMRMRMIMAMKMMRRRRMMTAMTVLMILITKWQLNELYHGEKALQPEEAEEEYGGPMELGNKCE